MKTTGLITFHRTLNYGSLLQTLATYHALKKLNVNVEVIDYRSFEIEKREGLKYSYTSTKDLLKHCLFWHRYFLKRISFSKTLKTMDLSKSCNIDSISKISEKYEAVIAGSDIIWGLDITNNDYTYFLDFAPRDVRKLSYASSIGNNNNGDINKLKQLLSSFDSLLVRENEGAEYIENLIGKKAQVVCDPTMLIKPDEWLNLFNISKKEKGYVLVYFDNDNHKCINDALKYAKEKNLKVYYLCANFSKNGYIAKQAYSLKKFIDFIYNASAVFTSSYHGVLFSLYFNKNLYFYRRAHSNRLNTLITNLNIGNLCYDNKDITEQNDIDFVSINKNIANYRDNSLNLLAKEIYEFNLQSE